MKKFLLMFVFLFLGLQLFASNFGISFGFPYLGVKYNISQRIQGEFRLNFDGNVWILGGHGYYKFLKKGNFNFYGNLGVSYTIFKNVQSLDGSGYLFSLYLNTEYNLTKKISLGLEFGPAFIGVFSKINEESYKDSGLEWIINLNVSYYFK